MVTLLSTQTSIQNPQTPSTTCISPHATHITVNAASHTVLHLDWLEFVHKKLHSHVEPPISNTTSKDVVFPHKHILAAINKAIETSSISLHVAYEANICKRFDTHKFNINNDRGDAVAKHFNHPGHNINHKKSHQ